MRTYRHLWILLVVAVLSACQTARKAAQPIEFTILQYNDVYEIAPLEGGKSGGLARVATVEKELLRENPNTISILAGDFLSPSVLANLKMANGERISGLQMVETLNAAGLDYATFGNHEFDLKDPGVLQNRINQSKFKYITCNAMRKAGDQIKPFQQQIDGQLRDVPKYVVHEFSNAAGAKVRVGLTGVVLPFNKQEYVSYAPVTASIKQALADLQSQADVNVAITHLAIDQDKELAAEVPGFALFIGGHDHTNMKYQVGNTAITKADANVKTVYIHRFTYYPKTKKTVLNSTLKKIDDTIADDPATKAVVEKWQSDAFKIMEEQGYKPERKVMEARTKLECTEYKVRSQQTNMGALTLQGFETVIPGADAYLLNSGSMRLDDDIVGTLTEYDILRTFPFGGPVATMQLPGETLARVLQAGLVTNITEGGYMQVRHIEQRDGQWWIKGEVLKNEKIYTIVLPDFVAAGKEANLGFLKDFASSQKPNFDVNNATVRNDIRDIAIYYMGQLGTY